MFNVIKFTRVLLQFFFPPRSALFLTFAFLDMFLGLCHTFFWACYEFYGVYYQLKDNLKQSI
jgi:hypothetical protein